MRKISIIILLVLIIISGCSGKDTNVNPANENNITSTAKEIPLKYSVDKTTLSYGYQSMEPRVEILDKSEEASLLVSLGIVECAGISVEKVTLFNDEINIYTSVISDKTINEIVVPQVIMTLEGIDNFELKDKKFNIIGTNYNPLNIKYNSTQALNNICAQYKLELNTTPHIKLIKENNNYFWDIRLHNVFAKNLTGNPLINLAAKVNSQTGQITEISKDIISEYINEGSILYASDNGMIFYRQTVENKKGNLEILWMYNGKENKKIYTTYNSIYTVEYNSKLNKIALIEYKEKNTDLFLIDLKDNTVQKITPIDYSHTWNLKWNSNKIYFINNDELGKSTVFEYNTSDNKMNILFTINKSIASFDIFKDTFVVNEFISDKTNTGIYITKDGNDFTEIDAGFDCKFLSNNKVLYLKKSQKENINSLWLYDLEANNKSSLVEFNVTDYSIYDDNTVIITGRSNYTPEFSVFKYSIKEGSYTKIAQIISKTVFYVDNFIYIDSIPPNKQNKKSNIYKVDLSKVSLE